MNRSYDPTRNYLLEAFDKLPTRRKNPDIAEYAETTIIPSGKYRGLKFSHDRAPYLKEPLKLLSPDSPYREVVLMFPAQSGKTTVSELATMYYITQVPSEILYATATETQAIKWLERRIMPRAIEAGVHFRSEVENASSRKTGNTSYSKLFPGGNIDIASTLSPQQIASETKRFVNGDEVDRWKLALGEEGSVINQLRARMQAWDMQGKALWFSTPTTEDASVIFQLFKQGDQRLFFLPCPHCGELQLLDFSDGKSYGLKWEFKNGHILKKSIVHVCQSPTCSREITESKKPMMLKNGIWKPQVQAEYDHMASFHINGLYSFQLSWYEMAVAYEESKKSAIAKQDFDQLKMGRPHRERGTRPKLEKIIENRGTYKKGTVPNGVLYLVMSVDVQEGTPGSEESPPRLEMEVLGIGAQHKTWSITYEVFKGDVHDPYSGAWEVMNKYAEETGLRYARREDGFMFPVSLVFIDSGDLPDVVYRFCERWVNTFPIKGFNALKQRKNEKPDTVTESTFKRYRPSRLAEDQLVYQISTNYYKTMLYNNLKIERLPADPQAANFCDFPFDYNEKYFDGLTAEEKQRDGSFKKIKTRNEPLDIRGYNLCAADVFLDSEVTRWKAWALSEKWRPDQIQTINHRWVIDEMARQTAIKKIVITKST